MAAVVLTLTGNCEAVVALTLTLAGTVQVAPVGEPEQAKVAVPLKPAPPIDKVYFAVSPALTVTELEPPEGTPRPRLDVATAVPESAIVC